MFGILTNLEFYWKPVLEILILWFVFYKILLFLKGTRAFQLLKGIIILVIAFFILQKLGLHTLEWLFTRLFAISIIAIVILFQPELRQGLAKLGQQKLFHFNLPEEDIEEMINEIVTASFMLSKKRIGALIAIQRETGLKNYAESGVIIDANLSAELIQAIFHPFSPLHDGGMIIQEKKIYACACLFPLSDSPELDKTLGMRHRAALGLSEETDAIVICISEETQKINVAVGGKMYSDLSKEQLSYLIKSNLKRKAK